MFFVVFWSKININQTYIFPMKSNRKKCNLNQLAGIMPIIGKGELEASIGGYYYYDTLGNKLGSTENGNGVYVLPIGSDIHSMTEYQLLQEQKSLGEQPDYIKERVVRRIAEDAGIPGMLIQFDRFTGAEAGLGAYTDMETGVVTFNLANPSFEYSNYWDLQFTVRHEMIHLQQYADPDCKNWSVQQLEYAAYTWMINQPEFKYCSSDYQERMKEMQRKYAY